MKVVVIGGNGLIGSKLVSLLREQGHEAVAASRNSGVNLLTGEGLDEALAGAEVVVEVTNPGTFEPAEVMSFFETTTANLLRAEAAAGVGHHVVVSIVGMEGSPGNWYFQAKMAQERLIRESGIPYSIVQATQFFEFVGTIADAATEGNRVRVPPVGIQPIASDDVAKLVGEVALGKPLNGTVEIGGPELFRMDELIRMALAAKNDPREVVTDKEAGYFGAVPGDSTLVPGDGARFGVLRFREWAG